MAKALTKTLNLFQLNKIDRDLFSWNGESVGFKRIFWWANHGAVPYRWISNG